MNELLFKNDLLSNKQLLSN